MSFKVWLRAIRAPFFTATIVPVVVGTTIAFHDTGMFSLFTFLLALVGMVAIHGGINLGNDYFDHKSGNDEANKTVTPFSGGSRVIQEGLIPARKIFSVSMMFFSVGIGVGLYFYLLLGNTILLIGLIGLFIGFFYTAPPFKFGYRGLGEILVGLGFGTMVILGSYYVQTATISLTTILATVPVAILIGLVLFINEFPDYEVDKSTGKRTLVVLLGKKNSIKLYQSLLALAYLWVLAMVALQVFPIFTLLVFLTLPMAMKAIRIARKNYNKVPEILPANATTIMIHLFFGLLFAAGYLLAAFF